MWKMLYPYFLQVGFQVMFENNEVKQWNNTLNKENHLGVFRLFGLMNFGASTFWKAYFLDLSRASANCCIQLFYRSSQKYCSKCKQNARKFM